jgi:hypothetical protein
MSDRLSLSQVAALTAYAAAMAGGQLLFKTAALGGWRWSARRADRWLSAQPVFFRCSHSLRRPDPSVGLDPELYPLSRAYPLLALAFALTPALLLVFAEPLSMRS